MLTQKLKYAGLSFIAVGLFVSLVSAGAFTTVSADRDISVAVEDDGNALLALESSDTEVSETSETSVAALRNNAGVPLETAYSASIDSPDLSVDSSDRTETIDPGGERELFVSCASLNGATGVATLQITVDSATSPSLTIRDATLTVPVSYDCETSGPPGDSAAFNDADNDGQYDPGERSYTAEELSNYDNTSANLVVNSAGTIDTKNDQISIKAKNITLKDTTLSSNKDLNLESESGSVDLEGSTIKSKNGEVSVKGTAVIAEDATIETNKEIKLEAEGEEIRVSGSTLSNKNKQITLKGASVTAKDATFTSNRKISVTSESGGIDVTNAVFESKNRQISVKSKTSLDATGASFDTSAKVSLTSTGDMTLTDAEIGLNPKRTPSKVKATLNTNTAELSVDGLVLADSGTLRYQPDVTVNGTPAQGELVKN